MSDRAPFGNQSGQLMTIEERLDRVEKQNRWMRGVLALVLVITGAVVLIGATEPISEVVKARKFAVANKDGKSLVTIGELRGGKYGVLALWNDKGKLLASIGPDKDGAAGMINTYNSEGTELVRIGVTNDGEGVVGVYHPSGMANQANHISPQGITEIGQVWRNVITQPAIRLDR